MLPAPLQFWCILLQLNTFINVFIFLVWPDILLKTQRLDRSNIARHSCCTANVSLGF